MDKTLAGTVNIFDRKSITVDGVESILGFDDTYVSLSTKLGKMIIEGENLKVENLSKEDENIFVTGKINSVFYTEEKAKSSLLNRIFK